LRLAKVASIGTSEARRAVRTGTCPAAVASF
jgi:hypothetical protein